MRLERLLFCLEASSSTTSNTSGLMDMLIRSFLLRIKTSYPWEALIGIVLPWEWFSLTFIWGLLEPSLDRYEQAVG